jgi:hypothetical protein
MAFTHEGYRGSNSGELPFPEREERGNGGGDDADMRVPPVGEGSEGREYRFGCGRCWAAGLIWSWARSFPRRPFSVFISFAYFLFLISLLLSNTFQIESKQGQINF